MKSIKWVIAGDIIKSRKINNRNQFQTRFENTMENINQNYAKVIEENFKITLGDEFAGIINNYQQILNIVLYLIYELREVNFRIGIATISADEKSNQSGYVKASSAINDAKKLDYPIYFNINNLKENKTFLLMAVTLTLFIYNFNRFSQRQKLIMYNLIQNQSQKTIAEKLDISQPAVSQAVTKIRWKVFTNLYQNHANIYSSFKNKEQTGNQSQLTGIIGTWNSNLTSIKSTDEVLKYINKNFAGEVASNFVRTIPGANSKYEFQGLLKTNRKLIDIILKLMIGIKEVSLGIGEGLLKTEIKELAIGMDGPVFYRARKALEKAIQQNYQIQYKNGNEVLSQYISDLLLLIIDIVEHWTEKQLEAVNLKKKEFSHREIAEKLNKSRTAITNRLARADWKTYIFIQDLFTWFLE